MAAIFLEHKLLCSAFAVLLLLSIICQIINGVIYRRMIKETDNMSATNNKLLKQCKLKFVNCYELNEGVANISVFVDKFLSGVSLKGISLNGLHHLSGQFILLSVAAAGIGACIEIINGATVAKILPYYIAGFLGLYIYFSVSGMMDIQGKKERLKVNLVDYLENHMVNKLRQSAADWEGLTGEKPGRIKEEGNAEDGQAAAVSNKVRAMREELGLAPERTMETAGDKDFSEHEEQELEELLREFFTP